MKKHIPNAITCCNLISGCVAIVLALQSLYLLAFMAIVVGAVFDFFDGMTARLLHVSSPIGKELDSLADVVTFGVAPSAMLFRFLADNPGAATGIRLLPYAAFLMAAFSALRLAKFNLDERQTMGFIGLPTPANALFWASLLTAWQEPLAADRYTVFILLAGMLLSCFLLVCELPMFALKFKSWGWRGNKVKYLFLLSCIPLVLLLGLGALAVIVAWYVLLSVIVKMS